MQEAREEGYSSPTVYRPDNELNDRLLESAYQRRTNLHLKIEMTDLRSGEVRTMFVNWDDGTLEALAYRLQTSLSMDPRLDRYEDYFWLFWRGWAGCLNGDLLIGLPAVTPDLLDKVGKGVPLRSTDLRRLQSALEWAYADASGEWGDTDSWEEGTISPGHLNLRRKVGKFIEERMNQLYGPNYENAPINT